MILLCRKLPPEVSGVAAQFESPAPKTKHNVTISAAKHYIHNLTNPTENEVREGIEKNICSFLAVVQ